MNRRFNSAMLVRGIFIVITVVGVSCSPKINAVYFSDLDSLKLKQISSPQFKEPLIQSDDILNITIQTLDPLANEEVNQAQSLQSSGVNSNNVSGYLVNKLGNVEIPMLGEIKLTGLSTTQAKDIIKIQAQKYYKDPTVQVRFANYKITVLGEVGKPASYTVPYERVSILDAISIAGDLTIFGKRDNVLLIRDNGETKDLVRLNLNSSALLTSPYFYLKQNDVLYVEPTKAKVAANNAPRTQLITIGIAVATLLVTLLTRI